MKKVLTVLALTAIVAGQVSAREIMPFSGTPQPDPESGSQIILEYDGGDAFFGGFGTYSGWSQLTVVNFEAPSGGPWVLDEAHYYLYNYAGVSTDRPAEVWDVSALNAVPVGVAANSVNWAPLTFPAGFSVVDISSYGLTYNDFDLFGVGTSLVAGDAIAVYYASADGNPGYSWSNWYGIWYNDTTDFDVDDGIRAGMTGGPTPTIETTWGGVKALYN